jgi:protein SCO1/2
VLRRLDALGREGDVLGRRADEADADRWWILTGPREELYRLVSEGFHLAVAERSPEEATQTPGEMITHSDRFVLVDASGRLRAYYHGTESAAVQQILRDLPML